MNIRNRLTVRFIFIVAVILVLGSMLIYIFSADYREEDFYNRLRNKANNTAKILIDVDEIDATLLQKLEKDNPVSLPNEKIIIYDFKNQILFSTDQTQDIYIDQNLLDRIRLEDEVRYQENDYEILGFLFKSRYDRFTVVAAATDVYGFNKLKNLRTILLTVFAISIVIVSIAGWLFAGKALEPISGVISQVDEISITSLNLRVDEGNGKDEIAKLAQTFNNMLLRLETSFKAQRNFIANASHELRTPLTSITGQLEVTLLNTRSNEDYRKVLYSVLDDIKNLNMLSNRLLLLAQTSSEDRNRKMVPLRIDDLIWQVRDDLLASNPSYQINIDLDYDLDDERMLVNGDEQLMKSALSNIMENGCKYSSNHLINILIKSSRFGLIIIFNDSGIGISEKDLPYIFEPFYRGSNTQNVKGSGIGLSIVKPILRLHGATIQVNSKESIGTTFIVSFPRPDGVY